MRPGIITERLRVIESVTDSALSYLPLEDLLQELLRRVVDILEADTAAILCWRRTAPPSPPAPPRDSRRRFGAACASRSGAASRDA